MSRNKERIVAAVLDGTLRMPLNEWNWSEGVALYGLFYHGWDERKDGTIGCLWARGNEWAAIVAVDLLEMLQVRTSGTGMDRDAEANTSAVPAVEAHAYISEVLSCQLAGLARWQDLSGLWTTVVTEPSTYLETSAAAGIAYAVAKAVL